MNLFIKKRGVKKKLKMNLFINKRKAKKIFF